MRYNRKHTIRRSSLKESQVIRKIARIIREAEEQESVLDRYASQAAGNAKEILKDYNVNAADLTDKKIIDYIAQEMIDNFDATGQEVDDAEIDSAAKKYIGKFKKAAGLTESRVRRRR